jgi:hypothetical protein
MLELMLLDLRWLAGILGAAALAELVAVRRASRLSTRTPAALSGSFVRQRIGLAIGGLAGVTLYAYLKDAYLADPFFHALYVYLVTFFLGHYLTGTATALASSFSGVEPGIETHLSITLVLFGLVVLRPQVSIFGFFCGAGIHLAERGASRAGASPELRRRLLILYALLLFLALNLLTD